MAKKSAVSIKDATDWKGSVTFFDGFLNTTPQKELKDVNWQEVCESLCPAKPAILSDKKKGQYFLPCLLKEAPLVGNTCETAERNGLPTVGKMRSKNHVTEASILVIDVDGILAEDFKTVLEEMKADGLTFLAYTSYSHGSPDKTGVRARLLIPLDRSLNNEDYEAAHRGFIIHYFKENAGAVDSSGSKMYQQQGTWATNILWANQAENWHHEGKVASADALLEWGKAGQESRVPESIKEKESEAHPASDANKVADACKQIGTFRDTKGAGQSEPLWVDCLGVVGHCIDGLARCQEWSGGHPGYDAAETAKKIAHRIKIPPTTCDQFRKTNLEGCEGCTQNCRSPITLGYEKVDALELLRQRYGLIKMNGRLNLFEKKNLNARTAKGTAERLKLFNRSDGKVLMMRTVRSQFPRIDSNSIVDDFIYSPDTDLYEGVEFNPGNTTEKYLNLWVGPTVIPKAGPWPLIKAFLLEIICDGDRLAYEYLIKYIAHALQRPYEKPGVMIIMLGGQGVGKGTLGRIFQQIWSATYIQVNNIGSVTGTFNAALERAYIVFMDEAFFAGDRRSTDALKSLVTEPFIHINEKHQPTRQLRSFHRFLIATNADHVKNTERDDRRDFTLRVSESRKGDHEYWKALHHEINNGGVEAMVHDLQAMDLTNFNVRNKPNTKELLEQKLHSLDHIDRWWYECLERGDIDDDGEWPDFVSTINAIKGIIELSGSSRIYRKPSSITVVNRMKKLCPSATQKQKQTKLDRHRGLSLPSLQQARAEFEKYIGAELSWSDAQESDSDTDPFLTPEYGPVADGDIPF